MPIDSCKFPDKEWLTLYEATAYVAWGEALDLEALPWHGYPSARTYDAEIQSAFNRCREELRGQGRCSDFLRLIENYSEPPFNPPTSGAFRSTSGRPPSARPLYRLILRREQAENDDEVALSKAEPTILQAFLSGKVAFIGKRDGAEETINAYRRRSTPSIDVIEGTIEVLQKETVRKVFVRPILSSELEGCVPNPSSPFADPLQPARIDTADADFKRTTVGRALRWTDVKIESASLVAWINEKAPAPGQVTRAPSVAEESTAPPIQAKITPGRTPYDTQWRIMEPIACKIYKEEGPYDRSVGFTLLSHAEKTLKEFRKLQKNDPKKYGRLRFPSTAWATKKIRGIRPDLDRIKIADD